MADSFVIGPGEVISVVVEAAAPASVVVAPPVAVNAVLVGGPMGPTGPAGPASVITDNSDGTATST